MEVPGDILVKLKCENCEEYLSQGPILLLDTGISLCGRCVGPETGSTRNTPYEQVAKLLIFPCKYKQAGCQTTVTFDECQMHETSCKYRPLVCPIAVYGTCEWTGLTDGLQTHCRSAHQTKVIPNSFKYSFDITRTNLENFLLIALNVLFLVQTKVCLTTRNIYHCVRLIGDPGCATQYEYDLVIENNGSKVTKHATVKPQAGIPLEEDSSIKTSFDGLFAILGSVHGATYTVTVRTNDDVTTSTQLNCVKCQTPTKPVYRENMLGWLCQNCSPPDRSCALVVRGCSYTDVDVKCKKHESYFCKYHVTVLNTTSLFNYHQEGYVWTVTLQTGSNVHIVNCHFGRTVCCFEQRDNRFMIHLRTLLVSKELYLYKCTVEISNPIKKQLCYTCTLEANYETIDDWTVELSMNELNSYIHSNAFKIKIDFKQNSDAKSCIIS